MAAQSSPVPVPGTGPRFSHSGRGDQFTAEGSASLCIAKDNGTIYATSHNYSVGSPHKWLQATDPLCDKSRIELQKGFQKEKIQEWCKWIFSNHTFKAWRYDKHSKLLWIHGDAGTGKTMLLAGIIDELVIRQENSPRSSTVAYYFCESLSKKTKVLDATAVFRGLIALLNEGAPALGLQPDFRKCSLESYEYGSDNSVYALSQQLKAMILAINHTVYFIIDAYDEYENMSKWKDLLDAMGGVSSSCSQARWLISSRKDCNSIRRWYEDWNKSKAGTFEIDMSSPMFSSAVDMYIDEKLSSLAWLKEDTNLRQVLQKPIREKAKSRYFWVSFICEKLETVEVKDSLDTVNEAPAHLGDMKAGSESVVPVEERYAQVDVYAHEGYAKFKEFKERFNMARSGNHEEGAKEKESSIYHLLEESIAAHKKAIDKAKEAHPHYQSAIIKADIGAAESYRELSHSRAFTPERQLKFVKSAEDHLGSAITRSREVRYGTLEQRAKYEKAILDTRKVIVSEKLEHYVKDATIRAILVGQAYGSREILEKIIQRSNDGNAIEWTNWWLNSLNNTIERLERG